MESVLIQLSPRRWTLEGSHHRLDSTGSKSCSPSSHLDRVSYFQWTLDHQGHLWRRKTNISRHTSRLSIKYSVYVYPCYYVKQAVNKWIIHVPIILYQKCSAVSHISVLILQAQRIRNCVRISSIRNSLHVDILLYHYRLLWRILRCKPISWIYFSYIFT